MIQRLVNEHLAKSLLRFWCYSNFEYNRINFDCEGELLRSLSRAQSLKLKDAHARVETIGYVHQNDLKVMMYPPQSYMLIAGDLHKKMFIIKHGICVQIDALGSQTLKGPGDLINLKSAVIDAQITTMVALTHVHCYEFDRKFYCDMQKKGNLFDIQQCYPSFRLMSEKVLYNITQRCDVVKHKLETQLSNLEKMYSFNVTQTQPCTHGGYLKRILQFRYPINPYCKLYLAWNLFATIIYA